MTSQRKYEVTQHMRCRETPRPHTSQIPKAVLDSAMSAKAHEVAAYRAIEHDCARSVEVLIKHLTEMIEHDAKAGKWRYYRNEKFPQCEQLAILLVAEFRHSSNYRKKRAADGKLSIVACADAMRMDRATFKDGGWWVRFLGYRSVLRYWYQVGQE